MCEDEFKKLTVEYGYVIHNNILAFQRGPLSNWYGAWDGQNGGFGKYNCLEQYMMERKALLFGDVNVAYAVMSEKQPAKQKALGRTVSPYNDDVWAAARYDIVQNGILQKFEANEKEREYLLATGDLILCEAAPWDNIWGVGTGPDDRRTYDVATWQGKNLLGKALMQTRKALSVKYNVGV